MPFNMEYFRKMEAQKKESEKVTPAVDNKAEEKTITLVAR